MTQVLDWQGTTDQRAVVRQAAETLARGGIANRRGQAAGALQRAGPAVWQPRRIPTDADRPGAGRRVFPSRVSRVVSS